MESFRDDFLAKLKDLVYAMDVKSDEGGASKVTLESWQTQKADQEKQVQDLYLSLNHVRFLSNLLGKQCRWYRQLQTFPDRFCLSAFAQDEIKLMKREWKEMTQLFKDQQKALQAIQGLLPFQRLIDRLYEKQDQLDLKRSESALDYGKEQLLNRLCHQTIRAQRGTVQQFKRIQQENLEGTAGRIMENFHRAFDQLNEQLIGCLKDEKQVIGQLERQSLQLGKHLDQAWQKLKSEMGEKIQGLRAAYDIMQSWVLFSSKEAGLPPAQGPSLTQWSGHQHEIEQVMLQLERQIRSTIKDLPLAPAKVCKDPSLRVDMGNQIQQIYQKVLGLQSRWQQYLKWMEEQISSAQTQLERAAVQLKSAPGKEALKGSLDDFYGALQEVQDEEKIYRDQRLDQIDLFEAVVDQEKQWIQKIDDFYANQIQCIRAGLRQQKLLYDQALSRYQDRTERQKRDQQRILQQATKSVEDIFEKETSRQFYDLTSDQQRQLDLAKQQCSLAKDIDRLKLLEDRLVTSQRLVDEIQLVSECLVSSELADH